MPTSNDWPTHQHDVRRSASSSQRLQAASLAEVWGWQSAAPPQPAWSGPAKYDAYRMVNPLRSMRNYDPVFHAVSADGKVCFGSSVDDSVHCLDLATGKQLWVFTTDAPVRIAPTFAQANVYFGSDDGFVYCVAADSGQLVWKYSPSVQARRFLNNGRLISLWPCRTGVLVDGGTAYFAAGMFPWEDSYLCAVDASTGRPSGPGRYVACHEGVPAEKHGDPGSEGITMEGAILASDDRLFIPQGRVAPRMFDRQTGTLLGSLPGGGGCFALLTEEAHLLHGPGNQGGWITDSDTTSGQQNAQFPDAAAAVVQGGVAYLLTRTTLSAVDCGSEEPKWSVDCTCPYALVKAGDVLVAGGSDIVSAYSAADGELLWQGSIQGKAHGLAVAGGCLLVATDEGNVHCFSAEVGPADDAPVGIVADAPWTDQVAEPTAPAEMALSPHMQFVARGTAVVRWRTPEPAPTVLTYGPLGAEAQRIEEAAAKTDHEVTLTDLRKDTIYDCTITAGDGTDVLFECDTHFDYTPAGVPQRPCPFGDEPGCDASDRAKALLARAGVDRGLCLLLGMGDERLIYEIIKKSGLRVIALETDAAAVARAREALLAAGLYGSRAAVHEVSDLDDLPVIGAIGNLMLVASSQIPQEAQRLVRPGSTVFADSGAGESWTRGPLSGAGAWSHQYGPGDNSAFSGETLAGVRSAGEMLVQWCGHPGPRYQPDRNGRKPAPLAINGRLFGQGRRRIVAVDAYNGTIPWSLEIPAFARFNMPRDCGNWCADDDHVFAAVKTECWRIDAATGSVLSTFGVLPGSRDGWDWEWGYIGDGGSCLIGSAVKTGSAFVAFVGHANWYDSKEGEATHPVCSDTLFAMAKESGDRLWRYEDGVIINSTITISGGRVQFVECRNAAVCDSDSRRVGMPELWQDRYMVALDASSGQKVWERPLETARGSVVFYMAAGEGKIVIMASDVADARYHTYAYDAADGAPLWDTHFGWMSDNHGGHMSHLAISSGRVFVRPRVLNLETGAILDVTMPGGGCGTYAMTDRTAIFRSAHVVMWDFEADEATSWHRLRPGCWISTVPACGMVLSPEAGGGCSCGSWLETSLGFMPEAR